MTGLRAEVSCDEFDGIRRELSCRPWWVWGLRICEIPLGMKLISVSASILLSTGVDGHSNLCITPADGKVKSHGVFPLSIQGGRGAAFVYCIMIFDWFRSQMLEKWGQDRIITATGGNSQSNQKWPTEPSRDRKPLTKSHYRWYSGQG